jgi:hypothetical protein
VIPHRPRWRSQVGHIVALLLVTSCTSIRSPTGHEQLGGARLEVIAAWTGIEQARFESVLRDFIRRTGVSVTARLARTPPERPAPRAAGSGRPRAERCRR